MTEQQRPIPAGNISDPSFNVREMLDVAVCRLDDLRQTEVHRIDHDIETEIKRLDEKFKDGDTKYQIQFNAAKEALGIALIAQEKAVAAALDSTKEAIGKAEIATDKRFDLLSEKIDGVNETLNKAAGSQGIYVTHADLSVEMEKLRNSIADSLKPLTTFMNSQTGKAQGIDSSWTRMAMIIAAAATIITLLIKFL